MACLYYENISFSPILGLPSPELPEWANGDPILVFMMLKHFSLISSQENRSNGMLNAFITKDVNFINSGHVGDGPLGGECYKKIANHL